MTKITKNKKYISFFQKVTTVGIVTEGKDETEAREIAQNKLKDNNPVEQCFYEEIPFEFAETIEYTPDLQVLSANLSTDKDYFDYTIKANYDLAMAVAQSCGKDMVLLTDEDFEKFIRESGEEFISKIEEKDA